MDYQLRGKLAFVTAGAHGIGEANRNGIAVTAGGVIFLGTLGDATFRAFDKDNGKVLWEKKMDSIPKVFGPFTKWTGANLSPSVKRRDDVQEAPLHYYCRCDLRDRISG